MDKQFLYFFINITISLLLNFCLIFNSTITLIYQHHLNLMTTLLIVVILFHVAYQQFSVPPTWQPNPYLETAAYHIKTDFQTTTQSDGATIPFKQAYSMVPKVAFSMIRYSGNDGLWDQDFFMKTVQVTNSQADVILIIQGVTNIRVFGVMYLVVHPDFKYHLNTFNDMWANYSSTSLSLSPINQYTNQVRIFQNYINYTQMCSHISTNHTQFGNNTSKNKVAAYLSGIFNYVQGSPTRDYPYILFDITTQVVNRTFFKVKVQVQPNYQIDLLKLSFISMDIQNIQTSKQYTIVYNTDRYQLDQDRYIPLQPQFFGNVFIGMLDYSATSPNHTLDFSILFQQSNSRIVTKKSSPHPNIRVLGGIKSVRLVTFYMKTWFCPVPYYYFNLITDMCDDYCASYFYGNVTAGQCLPCPVGCKGCDPSSPSDCIICDSINDFRILINNSCQCMTGYYLSNDTLNSCTSCTNLIPNCGDCNYNSSDLTFICNSCLTGWYLQNNTCIKCNMTGCISCVSALQCTDCNTTQGYTLVSNKSCQICPVSCNCDGYYPPILIDPNTGDQMCTTVCGDGLVRQLQQCDDGNSDNGDGCSSQCTEQKYWSCSANDYSCCVIDSSVLYLKIDDIIKTKNENSFVIKLSLYPHFSILTPAKLQNSLYIALSGIDAVSQEIRFQDIQKINIKYFYNQFIEMKQCSITFSILFAQSTSPGCNVAASTTVIFYPDSTNNLPLAYFDQKNYQILQKMQLVIQATLYASFGILFFSGLPCKIVGLQLFGVLQLAYFSLAQIQDLNLMLVPFLKLAAANGFNPHLFQNQSQLPPKIDYIQYDTLFLNNCGLMLGILVAQITIASIFYFISVLLKKFTLLHSISKRLLKQVLLTLLVFNSFNFAFAVGVHFKYSDPNHGHYLINSVAAILSLVIPLMISIGLVLTQSKEFGQFKDKFKPDRTCQLYFVITIIYRYALGYYIGVKNDDASTTLLIISISLSFLVYNLINLPFKSTLHNYRANICHFSQFTILLVANYYQSMMSTSSVQNKSKIFSPAFIDIAALMISVAVSFIGLGYELVNFIRSFKSKVSNSSKLSNESKMLQSSSLQAKNQEIFSTQQNMNGNGNGQSLVSKDSSAIKI